MKARELVEAFLRQSIEDKLKLCTLEQKFTFRKVFPHGVKSEDLESAYDLVIRTLERSGYVSYSVQKDDGQK